MAYASNISGGGISIPSVDYTLTKPLNVLGAVASGLGASNMILDQPNTNRARQIVKKQQGLVLGDKLKTTDLAVGPDGGLTTKMQDPLTYELARSLDAAKAQTESLQGANYQSQIDRRAALLPGEQEVLSGKAAELGGRTNLLDAKTQSILSPEVVETVTPSGETLQVVTGPTGAKEVGKPGTAGFELPAGVQIGDKVLDSTGKETGMIYGPKGIVPDRGYVVEAQQQKLEASKPKERPTSKFTPFVENPKLEQALAGKWVNEDPGEKATKNLETIKLMRNLAPKIYSGGIGGVLGKAGEFIKDPNTVDFASMATSMAQDAKLAGVGSQSDADMRLLAKQVPGTDKPLETNLAILDRHEKFNQRQSEYSRAITELQNKGYATGQAKQLWKEYVQANPLYTEKGNDIIINNVVPFNDYLNTEMAKESSGSVAGGEVIRATVAQAKAAGLNIGPGTRTIKGKTYIITE